MKVLVTGANGFVGSAICRAFLRRGHEVVALARQGSNTGSVPVKAELVRGDFTSGKNVRVILAEHRPDAVAHAAAVVSTGRPDLKKSLAVNVEGTRVLAAESLAAGAERFLLVSSMSAHPANKSVYGGTKLLAEAAARMSGPPLTVFRPSLVYGSGDAGIFGKLVSMLRKLPVVPLVGSGREPCRPVHVDDLADAMAASLDRSETAGRIYEIGGPENFDFKSVVREIRRANGQSMIAIPVPLPICRVIALAGEVFSSNPPLTSDNIEGIAKARPLCIEAARRELEFTPRAFEV